MISFIIGYAFLPNALISGIFLVYLLKILHGMRMVLCTRPPQSTVLILHIWYPDLLRLLVL